MLAAKRFAHELQTTGNFLQTTQVKVQLYGSLALTGKGHGTDKAILLGLLGEVPDQVDPAFIAAKLARIHESKELLLLGSRAIKFDAANDLVFAKTEELPGHSNGMRFSAYDSQRQQLVSRIFYSIGGGFILADGEQPITRKRLDVPIPFSFRNAADLLHFGAEHNQPIWKMILENESVGQTEDKIRDGVSKIWQTMRDCMERGLRTDGILPGGLNIRRRAPQLYRTLSKRGQSDPLTVVDWISLFAIAVNEENAAGGRVVTAPTNGAAGVIPAVASYYDKFVPQSKNDGLLHYFLTAGAIGILYKENASISGAEVGCQGEVGVACSMAAAGLAAALGGTNAQVEHAAEIAMEHNLGMTCDPVGGLVQIPCIERNAFGAVKAVNAARMAIHESGDHKVSLDQVIRTMFQTGRDMQARYKETSLGGLAVTVVEC